MSQASISNYFPTRKRSAVEETNINRAKKVLKLSEENVIKNKVNRKLLGEQDITSDILHTKDVELKEPMLKKDFKFPQRNRVIAKLDFDCNKVSEANMTAKKAVRPKHKKLNNQGDIQKLLLNMREKKANDEPKKDVQKINESTPPSSPVKNKTMDNVVKSDLTLSEIKNKLTRSARLAELKASLSRFNKLDNQLKEAEKNTRAVQSHGPSLIKFESIELEVEVSPKKVHSPAKSYLSPMKDASPRKNLFGLKSPLKSPLSSPVNVPAYQRFQHLLSPGKSSLTLPYNYRCLAETFRSIDTVCSIMYNRKETITFNKLKPAVQEMTRKNLEEQHFAQIKEVYPDAFSFSYEKMKSFGSRESKYELIIKPILTSNNMEEHMDPNILLERRRKLFSVLIEKVKIYHNEFLQSLDPPMIISSEKLKRWHPEFDIEKIPAIEKADFPQPPDEEKLTTGQEVLEKARSLFNCNTRMEKALERLKKVQEERATVTQASQSIQTPPTTENVVPAPTSSVLKGIPQALLERVRAKQAAKALDAMTRCPNKDKEAFMYSRLPDIARLMRNTYVVERKGVLALEEVIIKLNNSYRSYLSNNEIEQHLRLLEKSVPGWIVFHEIRGTLFIKLSRDGDMKRVMTRLEQLAKEKSGI